MTTAISSTSGTGAPTIAQSLLAPGSGVVINGASVVLHASGPAAVSFYDGSLAALGIGAGLLLTSGTAPGYVNTVGWFGDDNSGSTGFDNGDADIDAVVNTVFQTVSYDATTLSFDFTVADPAATSISFDLVFGSDEYPEWVDQFVDCAIVMVNGVNYALFNHDPNHPLSVVSSNLAAGYFQDNAGNAFPIEYDGVSHVLKIVAPIVSGGGVNHIKIGIADTGDHIYDSGVFLANFAAGKLPGSGVVIGSGSNCTDASDSVSGSSQDELFDLKGGDDIAYAGGGDDIVVAGAGNDLVFGGSGADNLQGDSGNDTLDGGDGDDTAVYSGEHTGYSLQYDAASSSYTISDNDTSATGQGQDKLTTIEYLKFADGLFSLSPSGLTPATPGGGGATNHPGLVTIAGIGSPGKTLGAVVSDPDGASGVISYQWQVSTNAGATWSDLAGATGQTLVVPTDAAGSDLRVLASYTDGAANAESPASAAKAILETKTGDLVVTLMQIDGPPGASVHNPLTTLVKDAIALGLSPNLAALAVKTVLGLPTAVNLQSYDAWTILQSAPADANAIKVEKIAVQTAILTSLSDDDTGMAMALAIVNAYAAGDTLNLANANDISTIIGVPAVLDSKGKYPQPLREIFDRNKAMSDAIADGGGLADIEQEWQDLLSIQAGINSTSIADLSIHINQAPEGFATALLAAGTQDSDYAIVAADLLAGYSDPEGSALSVSGLVASGGGTLQDDGAGGWVFLPDPGFSGPVELSYNVSDGQGGSAPATQMFVLAAVAPPANQAPQVSGTVTASATEDGPAVWVDALGLASDPDPADLLFVVESSLALPEGVSFDALTQLFTLNPGAAAYQSLAAGQTTPVGFDYLITDGTDTVGASAEFTVTGVNDAPVAQTASGSIAEDAVLGGTLAASDEDGDVPSFALDVQAAHGLVQVTAGGSYTYTPAANYAGPDSFRFVASDASASSASTLVSLTVTPVNDAPAGRPVISGITARGQMLIVDGSGVTDADGLGSFAWQWLRDGFAIDGAQTSVYLLADADVGSAISVRLHYTDAFGAQESVLSTATPAVTDFNASPTGTLSVGGTAAQGQVLSAQTDALADADGLGSFSYQWLRAGAAIEGATGSSYTLAQADVGASVRVRLSYTDGHGHLESLLSLASAPVSNVNDAPTGVVSIGGAAAQGQTLTASHTLADLDGLGTVTYAWTADGVALASGPTVTLGQSEVGKQITVTASYTDGFGALESRSSAATTPVLNVNDAPTGAVTISGTAAQGQTLTVSNTLADTDGIGAISYQWLADGVNLATGPGVTLGQSEVGKLITVTASYTDGFGTAESRSSAAGTPVSNVNDAPTGGVSISGTVAQGQTLTASSTLADADGLGMISYQWQADGLALSTGPGVTLGQSEVGKTITVTASYTDGFGAAESRSSAASTPVSNVNDAPTGEVSISGTAAQGQTLLASNNLADLDGLGTISYQWKADGANLATGPSVLLTQSEVGKAITVTASYTDGFLHPESRASAATAAVANVNDAPTVAHALAGAFARSGEAFSLPVPADTFSDIDGDTLSLSASLAGGAVLPAWLHFDPATGLFSGIPDAGDVGAVSITVTASDAALSAGSSFALTVIDPSAVILDGSVVDGYVAGAQIYVDVNGNNIADPGEETGLVTDAQGRFNGVVHLAGSLIAVGGTNIDTGLPNTLVLGAPAGSSMISPLTTLVEAVMDRQGGTAAAANAAVAASLGLAAVDLTSYDPLAQAPGDGTALAVQKANGQLAILATVSGEAPAAVRALAADAGAGTAIDLSDRTTVARVLAGTEATAAAVDAIAFANQAVQDSVSLAQVATAQTTAVTSMDTTAPELTGVTPADEAAGVSVSSDIVLSFGEAVMRGTGPITLRTAAGTVIASYEASSDGHLGIAGSTLTVNPAADLAFGTAYVLEVPGAAVLDLWGNAYAGLSTYNFTTAPNTPPVADNGLGSTAEDQALNSTLPVAADAQGQAISYERVSNAGHGSVTVSADGHYSYTPSANYNGTDSFSYRVTDTLGASNSYTVALTVNAVNDAPTGTVTISGTPTQGQTLTAGNTLADVDGLGTVGYQWQADGAAITGATGAAHVLTLAEVGKAITLIASYTDGGGTLESRQSVPSALVASLGQVLAGTAAGEPLTGGAGNDTISGLAGNDTLTGAAGNDQIDGGTGADQINFTGIRAEYTLSGAGSTITAADRTASRDGTDSVSLVEILHFSDRSVDLGMAGKAASIPAGTLKTLEELYVGFFNRVPEAAGLGYWIDQMHGGMTLSQVANQFYEAGVVFGNYPSSMTNPQFIREIYKNVLGRPPGVAPTDAEVGYWEDRLVRNVDTKGTMVLQMLSDVHTYFEGITDLTNPNYAYQFVSAHLNNKAAVANWYAVQQGLSLNVQADNVAFGIQMAALITPTDTAAAIGLVGLTDSFTTV